jgi:hypothetical protein
VLLGAGLDLKTSSGLLNVSLMWGISTRNLFSGNIREWEVLNQDFDATNTADPEEFPEHYYDWALRGSNVSLRVSYYFQLTGKDKGDKEGSTKPMKAEKPEKEKKEKSPKPDDEN